MQPLKQSSTAKALVFFLADSTDHVTGKTGLSPTVVLSKNGGSFASPSGTVSEIGNGFYKVAGNATDTNTLGALALSATATGADQCTMGFCVVAYDPDTTSMGLVLAKTTNITGFNDLSAAAVNAEADTALSDAGVTTTVTGRIDAAITTRSTLTAAGVWDAMLSGITTASSIGKLIKDNLDAAISSRSTYAGADTSGTTTLLSRIASALTITSGKVTVGTNDDKTGYALATTPPTAAATASAVRTELAVELARVDVATSTRSSHSAADVWAVATRTLSAISDSSGITTLLSRLTSTRAGLLDNLDATVSSRLASGSYTAPANSSIAAIKTVTDALPTFVHTSGKLWVLNDEGNPLATAADAAAIKTIAERLNTALELDGSNYRFTIDALANAPVGEGGGGGDGPSAGAIADAVRTELAVELARIDAAITSRSTYAGGDTSGVTTLLSRIAAAPPTASEINTALTTAHGTGSWQQGNTTAPDNTSIAAIKVITDRLNGMLQLSGSLYRFTVAALANAPVGEGGGGGGTGLDPEVVDKLTAAAQVLLVSPYVLTDSPMVITPLPVEGVVSPVTLDLTIRQGITFGPLEISCKDAQGAAMDLTGWKVFARAVPVPAPGSRASAFQISPTISDAVAGKITLAMTDEQTQPFAPGDYRWDLVLENAEGERLGPVAAGSCLVLETISHR